MKERILIKVSGGSLKSNNDIFDFEKIKDLASQISQLTKKYCISLVIGGGNIFRGNCASEFNLNRVEADHIGMLATTINGMLLKNIFDQFKIRSRLFSALKINSIIDEYTTRSVNEALDNDYVCIFVGGTGLPFFTTDTGAALRAAETSSRFILMGKNNADGIFDKDPIKNKNAKHIPYLTYKQALDKNLKIMDHSAIEICEENNISIIVFNINRKNAFVDAMKQKIQISLVSKEEKYDWLK